MDAYNKYIFIVYIYISKHKNSYRIYITNSKTIDKKTKRITYLINIKSKGLRDILRSVLQGVDRTFLKEDKPIV